MAEKKYYGFGFNPAESMHHFMVVLPFSENEPVMFYERSRWSRTETQTIFPKKDRPKAALSRHKWDLIAGPLMGEFNRRLKKQKLPPASWDGAQVPVERLLGKEMMVLVWAVEESDPALVGTAVRNWAGFSPEERWWLFTMTNAGTGNLDDRRGWRRALRYALTENPVDESRDIVRFEKTASSKKKKAPARMNDDNGQRSLF